MKMAFPDFILLIIFLIIFDDYQLDPHLCKTRHLLKMQDTLTLHHFHSSYYQLTIHYHRKLHHYGGV